MSEKNMSSMRFMCPKHFEQKIRKIASLRHTTMSRLVAIAIDNELHKDVNIFSQDLTLPDLSKCPEFEYAHEAGKIATFLKGVPNGTGLDIMMLLRYEIGVPDRERFLAGFTELLNSNIIEAFKSKQHPNRPRMAEDYLSYRVKSMVELQTKRTSNSEKDYATYQKLKKQFKGE